MFLAVEGCSVWLRYNNYLEIRSVFEQYTLHEITSLVAVTNQIATFGGEYEISKKIN